MTPRRSCRRSMIGRAGRLLPAWHNHERDWVRGKCTRAPHESRMVEITIASELLLATTSGSLGSGPVAGGFFGYVPGLASAGQVGVIGLGGALAEGMVHLAVPLAALASGHEKIQVCGQLAPGWRPSF